ncbi:MAG: amino acid permease [Alphaproteobacteria bacterium]|nr:amino acid permease [Alphaproteobacteria bacterium]
MQKQITAILLVAGTCIGGGTIALPIALAKLGVAASLTIMLLTWLLAYYTSLVSVELNLQSEHGLSLGALGRAFSGKVAAFIGDASVKVLSYALLAVYIYGISSIIQKLAETYWGYTFSSFAIETWISAIIVVILLAPIKLISKVNYVAFLVFVTIFLTLVAIIAEGVNWHNIPWGVNTDSSGIASVVTVVFTSFGYQVIFHTLRDYCGRNSVMLRRVFLIGSFIPAVVYMLWTSGVLSVISISEPAFFTQMIAGKIDVGDIVARLAAISKFPNFQIMVWWMSIFAIFTSIIGVGVGLVGSLDLSLQKISRLSSATFVRRCVVALIVVLPTYIVAAVVPNAFIRVLGFAGSILVVVAILLPIYLFFKAGIKTPYLPELKKWALVLCSLIGLAIIVLEFCLR